MKITELTTIPQLLRNVVKYVHPENHPFLYEKVNNQYEAITYKTTLDNADAEIVNFLKLAEPDGVLNDADKSL